MAEPQTNNDAQKAAQREAAQRETAQRETAQRETGQREAKAAGTGGASDRAEPRSFGGDGAKTMESAVSVSAETAKSAMEGGRQMVEAGRRAGRNMADAWNRSVDPFMAFQYDMTRWFDEMWRQTTGLPMQAPLRTARPMGGMGAASLLGMPAADLRETNQAYELAIELPGVDRQDVELSASNDTLTVIGHKAEETHEGGGAYRVSERRYGHFERTFPLPDDIDRSSIKASFRDGVLRITLPKTDEAALRKTKIDIG